MKAIVTVARHPFRTGKNHGPGLKGCLQLSQKLEKLQPNLAIFCLCSLKTQPIQLSMKRQPVRKS